MSWKLVGHAPKAVVQAALAAHEALDEWDGGIVLTGSEIAEDRPDEWVLEAYLPHRPDKADKAAITALFGSNAPRLAAEKLPDTDWVAETQKLVAPIRAGRFHVHTLDYAADTAPDTVDLVVPAAQAFGTGQHATTAGCLAMLDLMKRRGTVVRNFADVGTGTGLLAFAALRLWPGARAVASDIDAVCEASWRWSWPKGSTTRSWPGARRTTSSSPTSSPGRWWRSRAISPTPSSPAAACCSPGCW